MGWKMGKFSDRIICVLFLVLLAGGCKEAGDSKKSSRVSRLPYYGDPAFQPHWLPVGSDSIWGLHSIPNFKLVNQLGDTVTHETFAGKIYVADFFFTSCPGICPKMTANMARVQEAFKTDADVLLLSHSVSPEYDSVPVLKRYAEMKDILPDKWHLVTGDRKQIYDLGRYAYMVEEDLGEEKNEDDFLHTENFVLVDGNGHIRGIYNGLNKTAIAQLIADIRTLKSD